MFETLRACGALARLMPELDRLWGVPQPARHHPEIDAGVHVMMAIDMAARLSHVLPVRFAVLVHDLGKGRTDPAAWPSHHGHEARSAALAAAVAERWRVSAECRDLAVLVAREHGNIGRVWEMRPGTVVELLDRADAWRKPERFVQILDACEADHRGRAGLEEQAYTARAPWLAALAAAREVDAGAIAGAHAGRPQVIRTQIHEARTRAVTATLAGYRGAHAHAAQTDRSS